MTRLRRTSNALCALALGLAACGSSAKKVDPVTDLALANRAILTTADLPGYAATPYQPSGDIPASAKQSFATCLNVKTSIFDDTVGAQKVHSDDFKQATTTVSASVEIDPTRSDVTTGWNTFTKSGFDGCMQHLFDTIFRLTLPSGATVGTTTVGKFDPAIGNRSDGFEAKTTITYQGRALVSYIDLLLVARDRAGIELDTVRIDQPFDRATEIALARTMYDRVGTKAN